jgi:hypothetical protein
MAEGASSVLKAPGKTFTEDVNFNKPDAVLTIDGPTIIKGSLTISYGTLIANNLVIQ